MEANPVREGLEFGEAPGCGVGQSKICEGQGLFALKDFAEGELVADYSSTAKDWLAVPFEELPEDHAKTCWWVGENTGTVRLANPESVFMRANHSKDPNCEWDPKKRTLVARRRINSGGVGKPCLGAD
jgi:hypothetical protein